MRGSLDIGRIPISATINVDIQVGYPSVVKMFLVISSSTNSPNIINPSTPVVKSIR